MNLGMTELIVIFAIILVLFGGRRLPGLGKAVGDTIREFKKGIGGEDDKTAERTEERVERQAQQLPTQDSPATQTQSEKEKNRS